MTALQYAVIVLASYRITRFFVKDSLIGFGPDSGSKVSVRLDQWAYDNDGADRTFVRGKVGDLLTCVWCLGFWVSAVVYTAAAVALGEWGGQPLAFHGIAVFAVAGGQGFLSSRLAA
jgi:hypothetical protein